ncbi:hypothetical protein [Arthrobacter burdickii]|uniref:Uncharacterized protein n=1 Tax=Arthrobacter burdickii TaxID=3035920 RepID=A0ABT8JWJ4_9MICC|nr:hypothetical protein [Arthrobacter burdickii]MDN4609550.1 hypothetical protein [Arthrobacter burdickii]
MALPTEYETRGGTKIKETEILGCLTSKRKEILGCLANKGIDSSLLSKQPAEKLVLTNSNGNYSPVRNKAFTIRELGVAGVT